MAFSAWPGTTSLGQVQYQASLAYGSLVDRFRGTVTCYAGDLPGRARFSGEVTHLTLGTSTNTGMFFVYRVIDRGEGADAPPDAIAVRRTPNPIDCAGSVGLDPDPVSLGNIRVR